MTKFYLKTVKQLLLSKYTNLGLLMKQILTRKMAVSKQIRFTIEKLKKYYKKQYKHLRIIVSAFLMPKNEVSKMIDVSLFGDSIDYFAEFENKQRNDKRHKEDNDRYNAFVEKFKPKKTTDDCYTPDNVYNAIADWVAKEYGKDKKDFVRPFYPGGNYQNYDYPPDCIVVDNPPFSILTQIYNFYLAYGIKFFLFAPTFTIFGSGRSNGVCCLVTGSTITYENGAQVNTSFITNLETTKVKSTPTLYMAIKNANDENVKAQHKELPKYIYPDEVLTAAMVKQYSKYGIEFRLNADDLYFIRELDHQKKEKQGIYGGGFLLSDKAMADKTAAEKAAAEKAAATVWQLSEREKKIISELGIRTLPK